MKANLLKNKKRMMTLAAVLVLLLAIGGISAYFTSTDNATNQWTVGDVTIELLEEEYDKVPETERQNITTNKVFTKDPVVRNTGTNDALSEYQARESVGYTVIVKQIVADLVGKNVVVTDTLPEELTLTEDPLLAGTEGNLKKINAHRTTVWGI